MILNRHYQCVTFAGPLRTIFCGGMAGVSLWIAIFPADVVKSRIQVHTTHLTMPIVRRTV